MTILELGATGPRLAPLLGARLLAGFVEKAAVRLERLRVTARRFELSGPREMPARVDLDR
jgi:hypothetical protein